MVRSSLHGRGIQAFTGLVAAFSEAALRQPARLPPVGSQVAVRRPAAPRAAPAGDQTG